MVLILQDQWVAGFTKDDGTEVREADGLKEILFPEFELLEQKDTQAIVKWKSRVYMLCEPEITVWKKLN